MEAVKGQVHQVHRGRCLLCTPKLRGQNSWERRRRERVEFQAKSLAVDEDRHAGKRQTRGRARDIRGGEDPELSRHVEYVFDPTRSEVGPTLCEGAAPPEGFPFGTVLRNGPNSKYGIGKEHVFDGDGMIHGCSFLPSGKVIYFNRWVESIGYKKEKKAGKKLYKGVLVNNGFEMLSGVVGNILLNDALETSGSKDTTNTAVVYHANRILALMEAQKPAEMDLQISESVCADGTSDVNISFETKQVQFDFGGELLGNMTAHPKVDPRTGEMLAFSYDMTSKPHLRYTEISKEGKISHSVGVYSLDRGTMSHDMAITETHAVLLDLPIYFDLANVFIKGEFPVQFQRNAQARLGIIERGGGSEVQWFEIARQGNVFHVFNAHNDHETGEIVLHAMRSEPEKDGYIFNDYAPSYLHEWRLDPKTNGVKEKQMGEIAGEFPCINPNYVGVKAQYGYMLQDGLLGSLRQWQYPPIGIVYTSLVKYDLQKGEVIDRWDSERGMYIFEPQFVPRVGSKAEDDGFLAAFATNAAEDQSFMLILDASDLSKGPVSQIKLPQKVASGLHGCFVPLESGN